MIMRSVDYEHCLGVARMNAFLEKKLGRKLQFSTSDRSLFLEFLRLIDSMNEQNTFFEESKLVINGKDVYESLERLRDTRVRFLEECSKSTLMVKKKRRFIFFNRVIYEFNDSLESFAIDRSKKELLGSICRNDDKENLSEINRFLFDCYKFYVRENVMSAGIIRC